MTQKNQGIIAAGHPKTAEAGQIMFDWGGNAFDAAIAALLASFVVESVLSSAGGGGFLLAHTSENRNYLFDFFTQTPRQKKAQHNLEFYPINVNFGDAEQAFHIGRGSIAVPGNLLGAFEVHRQLGKLPFKEVVKPAIEYAKNGFIINAFQGFAIKLLEPILTNNENSRQIYAPEGKLLTAGQRGYMKNFADTLSYLSEVGIQDFYHGEIAHQIAKDMQEGGYLTLKDLELYQVIKRQPLQIDYRGHQLLTNPPPSSGGILIAFALKLLETQEFNSIQWGSSLHLESLAQVMALTNVFRQENAHQTLTVETFLCPKTLQTYQTRFNQRLNKWGSTTHISVMDHHGNAVSVTTSNGEGSSYVIPKTDIMLNNMLGEADLNPVGFHQWQPNQRITSMMSPTMVLKNGKPEIVLGSGGSNRIRTAILQVILNLLDFGLSIDEAIHRPRVHWENQVFSLEPPVDAVRVSQLQLPPETQVVLWQEQNMFFGGVHTVRLSADGTMEGVGDSRRGGVALSSE